MQVTNAALRIDWLTGKVFVDDQPVTSPRPVYYENCVSVGKNSSVCIFDGLTLAATLAEGTPPSSLDLAPPPGSGSARLLTFNPPTNLVSLLYYRRSYRTQIGTPGGSVGIRV